MDARVGGLAFLNGLPWCRWLGEFCFLQLLLNGGGKKLQYVVSSWFMVRYRLQQVGTCRATIELRCRSCGGRGRGLVGSGRYQRFATFRQGQMQLHGVQCCCRTRGAVSPLCTQMEGSLAASTTVSSVDKLLSVCLQAVAVHWHQKGQQVVSSRLTSK